MLSKRTPKFSTGAYSLKTNASTKEILCLSMRKHENGVLWMLAESTMPQNHYSYIHLLAIATVEALAAIEARRLGDTEVG